MPFKVIYHYFCKRNNGIFGDDKNEPYPNKFSMLKVVCTLDEPFIVDIDNDLAVWNYPYDKVIVTKHNNCNLPIKKQQ